jgi:hypothetical protein
MTQVTSKDPTGYRTHALASRTSSSAVSPPRPRPRPREVVVHGGAAVSALHGAHQVHGALGEERGVHHGVPPPAGENAAAVQPREGGGGGRRRAEALQQSRGSTLRPCATRSS